MTTPANQFKFSRNMRLRKQHEFDHVYKQRVIHHTGPLRIFAATNQLTHPRLGLSVSRKVGNAVTRNKIKRLLREAFRLTQHDLPPGYDFIIVVRKHDTLSLTEYQDLLLSATNVLTQKWQKRNPSP